MRNLLVAVPLQMVRKLRGWPMTTVGVGIATAVFFGHSSLGLVVLLSVHAWRCFSALIWYSLKSFTPCYYPLIRDLPVEQK